MFRRSIHCTKISNVYKNRALFILLEVANSYFLYTLTSLKCLLRLVAPHKHTRHSDIYPYYLSFLSSPTGRKIKFTLYLMSKYSIRYLQSQSPERYILKNILLCSFIRKACYAYDIELLLRGNCPGTRETVVCRVLILLVVDLVWFPQSPPRHDHGAQRQE